MISATNQEKPTFSSVTPIEITYGDMQELPSIISNNDVGTLEYRSSNESVVTVTSAGEITAVGVGEARITVKRLKADGYNESPVSDALTITVIQRPLVIEGLEADTRTYNGKNIVTLKGGTLNGVLDTDTILCYIPTIGTMSDAHVGTDKVVSVLIPELKGSARNNYIISEIDSVTVEISKATITITPDSELTKIYGLEDEKKLLTYKKDFVFSFSCFISS